MLGQPSSPILAQAEQAIQAKIPQQLQNEFQSILKAGLTIMQAPQLAQTMKHRLMSDTNPIKTAGEGAARMMAEINKQGGNIFSNPQYGPLAMPCALMFAYEYLDMSSKVGKIQITPQVLSHTVQSVGHAMLPLFGVTPDKMHSMIAQAHAQKSQSAISQNGIIGAQTQGA